MTADVIPFRAAGLFDANSDRAGKVADNDHNRNREDQGPPIGSSAWTCNCGCFAFYITPGLVPLLRVPRAQVVCMTWTGAVRPVGSWRKA